MAKNDQQEAYEKHLTATLARVIDFVKFAEAKNAALLTFSSAWTLATINILNKFDVTPPIWTWCGGVALFFSSHQPCFPFGHFFQKHWSIFSRTRMAIDP